MREQHDQVDHPVIFIFSNMCIVKVDRIFLVEATVTHKGMRKPLVWDRLKFTQRFSFVNATKVDHVVVDDQKGVSKIGRF